MWVSAYPEADNVRDKSIPVARNRGDVSVLTPAFPEDAPHDRDHLGEIGLLHHQARPQLGQERVLLERSLGRSTK